MPDESPKSDLLQGTLDVLILKIIALGPVHGYAVAQRLQQISRDVLQVQQGSLYPPTATMKAASRDIRGAIDRLKREVAVVSR